MDASMENIEKNGVIMPPRPIVPSEKASRKKLYNDFWIGMLWLCGGLTLAILILIIGYIMFNGLGVINWNFLTQSSYNMGKSGGIYPMIVATIVITILAIAISTPLSVCAGIYLSEYARQNGITTLIRFGADCLAGIPSIMLGMFGYILFVYYMHMGFSLLAGALTLAIMALPIILRVSEEAIKVVPQPYRLGSMAMGATKWQTIRKVVLPTAFPGIVTGVILGMGRAVGETAAVMLTAGTVAKVPTSLFSPIRTMRPAPAGTTRGGGGAGGSTCFTISAFGASPAIAEGCPDAPDLGGAGAAPTAGALLSARVLGFADDTVPALLPGWFCSWLCSFLLQAINPTITTTLSISAKSRERITISFFSWSTADNLCIDCNAFVELPGVPSNPRKRPEPCPFAAGQNSR